MAIIALVMTKTHRAVTNMRRQPMMMIAAWAGRASGVGIGARIVPPKWKGGRYVPLVALIAAADLFDRAKELLVGATLARYCAAQGSTSLLVGEQHENPGNQSNQNT